MSLHKITKPDLQSIQSMSNPQSPEIAQQFSPHPGSASKDSILPPSNLTDIESIEDQHNQSYNRSQNTTTSTTTNHHNNTTSSSAYDSTSENIQHSPDHQLLLTKSNTSSKENIPVTIKLSQLPTTSSSSLLIGRQPQSPTRQNMQMSPVSAKLTTETTSKSIPTKEPTATPSLTLNEIPGESAQSTSAYAPVSTTPHKRNKSVNSPAIPFDSPQFSHKKRESTMSNISHYSGTVEYDAVPMTVKRSSSSKIKYVNKPKSVTTGTSTGSERGLIETSQLLGDYADNDDTDEEDQSSILLGKLPTTSVHSSDDNEGQYKKVNNPDKSFVTNIEGSIPARSPRRPTSMVASSFNIDDVYQLQQQHAEPEDDVGRETPVSKGRKLSYIDDNKRRSIQINDGLEKLMLDASSLNSDPELPSQNQLEDEQSRNITSPGSTYIGKAYGITYTDTDTDSQEITPKYDPITNDPIEPEDIKSITSKRSNDSVKSTHSNLPPRPKQDDIIKARRISSNLQRQQQQQQGYAASSPDHESAKLREIQPPNHSRRTSSSTQDPHKIKSREMPPSRKLFTEESQPYPPSQPHSHSHSHSQSQPRGKLDDFKAKHRTGIIGDVDSDFATSPDNPNFPLHSTTATTAPVPPVPAKSDRSRNVMVDDDGFYDVREPIVIQQPASRAKSVRKSIKRPTSTKRKKKASQRSKASGGPVGGDLRPFNYTTLISLLESMNGTIIGEEFNNLDIPIKEKQLIEKIIDSLSRLTSDMIIDQTRYDVGIERLEKCLRVLEGFL
ncbi:hypothetical protein Cantr_00627 [Candida viswanathii]|uniref:Protein NBA1 n=1 Tax=Candida viswanathii TaxID=5486 RepID=A0A367YGP7_9ASCO|nr:hypothetical protein Cantr_00627 [Candida viswanathii]